ncbi:MAG: hypothetical protein KIS87_10730 [Phycisphaeraceae bacterium]|nr:hypothetical protein [Phycisphaeraceae bacterium]
MWCPEALVEACIAVLRAEAERLDAEQAVHGLDALDETAFHPILAAGLAGAGLGVLREQPYPGVPTRRARHAERERCDLVVLERQGLRLLDETAELRRRDRAAGTLFEEAAANEPMPADAVPAGEAVWLEVKAVGQFTYVEGFAGPNRRYSAELVGGPLADARKLAADCAIRLAGVLVVLFTADAETAGHDLHALVHKALDRDLPVGAPILDGFDLTDRIGNARCTVALVPVRSRHD